MFRDVRECLDAGNRLHTLFPILIDVEQGICNGSIEIFKNSIQQYIIFVYSFFLKNTIKNLKLHLVKYYQKSNSKQMFQF